MAQLCGWLLTASELAAVSDVAEKFRLPLPSAPPRRHYLSACRAHAGASKVRGLVRVLPKWRPGRRITRKLRPFIEFAARRFG
jgi:hypothetical protein